jgi:multiple sugar transport system ATP-binding protein
MDEPLSNLDASLRSSMRAEVKRLHRELAATIVYVTHDQTEAMTLGDRIAVMRAGDLLQLATPALIYERPANTFVATFMGLPPMNLLPGERRGDLVDVAGARFRMPWPRYTERSPHRSGPPGGHDVGIARDLLVGVRPEHLSLERNGHRDGLVLSGAVELAETTGADTFLHVTTDGGRIVARTSGPTPRLGERVHVRADLTNAHLFDRSTGERIE